MHCKGVLRVVCTWAATRGVGLEVGQGAGDLSPGSSLEKASAGDFLSVQGGSAPVCGSACTALNCTALPWWLDRVGGGASDCHPSEVAVGSLQCEMGAQLSTDTKPLAWG